MFDITSSKLLLLGIVALLVIGPKDLPALLRTIGKYVGIIRGHAKEFRAQFDEAMRETELDQLKKDVETIAHETESSMQRGRPVGGSAPIDEARRTIDALDIAICHARPKPRRSVCARRRRPADRAADRAHHRSAGTGAEPSLT